MGIKDKTMNRNQNIEFDVFIIFFPHASAQGLIDCLNSGWEILRADIVGEGIIYILNRQKKDVII